MPAYRATVDIWFDGVGDEPTVIVNAGDLLPDASAITDGPTLAAGGFCTVEPAPGDPGYVTADSVTTGPIDVVPVPAPADPSAGDGTPADAAAVDGGQ